MEVFNLTFFSGFGMRPLATSSHDGIPTRYMLIIYMSLLPPIQKSTLYKQLQIYIQKFNIFTKLLISLSHTRSHKYLYIENIYTKRYALSIVHAMMRMLRFYVHLTAHGGSWVTSECNVNRS